MLSPYHPVAKESEMNTAVLTRTLTVNAAFLSEIKEDNCRLRELLTEGADDAAHGNLGRISARDRVELYLAIRDQLGLHFALEDAYGYFHDAIEEQPWLAINAKRLQSQHDMIFRHLCVVVDAAECILYREYNAIRVKELLEAFMAFYCQLAEHEHAENELILAAFDDDIGVGD